jgi:hypothetical protein
MVAGKLDIPEYKIFVLLLLTTLGGLNNPQFGKFRLTIPKL